MLVDASREVPLLPLRNLVPFPGTSLPVEIGRASSLRLVDGLQAGRSVLLVGTQKDPDVEEPKQQDLHPICVECSVVRIISAEHRRTLVLRGLRRRRLTHVMRKDSYLVAMCDPLEERRGDHVKLSALRGRLLVAIGRLVTMGIVRTAVGEKLRQAEDVEISDLAAGLLPLRSEHRAQLLLELDIERRHQTLIQIVEDRLTERQTPVGADGIE
jgi:ATP-dependent Lon protease